MKELIAYISLFFLSFSCAYYYSGPKEIRDLTIPLDEYYKDTFLAFTLKDHIAAYDEFAKSIEKLEIGKDVLGGGIDSENVDTILAKIPYIENLIFDLKETELDSLYSTLHKVSYWQKEWMLFYDKDSKRIHEFYDFSTYFLGKLDKINHLTPIVLLNTNFNSTIHIDYFLVDSIGAINDGMINLAFIEKEQACYSSAKGRFINNRSYVQTTNRYELALDENTLVLKDSSSIHYTINDLGAIRKKVKVIKKSKSLGI
jgi:hypothetical protein